MRLSPYLAVFLSVGAVWGFLASVFYERVMGYLVFPIGVPVALTVLLPGAVGRITAVRMFGLPPFGTISFQVEASAAIISMCTGIAILFFIWWLCRIILRQYK